MSPVWWQYVTWKEQRLLLPDDVLNLLLFGLIYFSCFDPVLVCVRAAEWHPHSQSDPHPRAWGQAAHRRRTAGTGQDTRGCTRLPSTLSIPKRKKQVSRKIMCHVNNRSKYVLKIEKYKLHSLTLDGVQIKVIFFIPPDHLLAIAIRPASTENVQSGREVSDVLESLFSLAIDLFIEPLNGPMCAGIKSSHDMTLRRDWVQTMPLVGVSSRHPTALFPHWH